jgi:hypothetical protein
LPASAIVIPTYDFNKKVVAAGKDLHHCQQFEFISIWFTVAVNLMPLIAVIFKETL